MKVLRVFFVGLVYGWLMRWLVDRVFLEDNLRMLGEENAVLRQRIQTLEASGEQQYRPVKRMKPAPPPEEKVEPAAAIGSGANPPRRDDLKMIKGIGPKMEERLNDAGVYTFEQLSRLKASELQAILGASRRGAQNSDELLSQAKKFARKGPKG